MAPPKSRRYNPPVPKDETSLGGPAAYFVPTLWTVVLKAKGPDSPERSEALDRLFRIYWKPVYFFLRRKGLDVEAAKDLAQSFFAALLEKDFLKSVDREKGKFRTFLLACLDHHLSDARDRQRAQKRGGGRAPLSLDFIAAEAELPADPRGEPPERAYERAWAFTILDRALAALRREFTETGKEDLFRTLRSYVSAGPEGPDAYAEAARKLKMTEEAMRVAVHRARRRYRELLREEVRGTVDSESAVDDEIADLLRILA